MYHRILSRDEILAAQDADAARADDHAALAQVLQQTLGASLVKAVHSALAGLTIDKANVSGLDQLTNDVAALKQSVDKLDQSLATMTHTLSNLKLPTPVVNPQIKLPPLPAIHVPKTEVTVRELPNPKKAIRELLLDKDATGQVTAITEVYDDGSQSTLKGLGTKHITVHHD